MSTVVRRPEDGLAPSWLSARSVLTLAPGGLDTKLRRRASGLRTPEGVWRWQETICVGVAVVLIAAAVLVAGHGELDPRAVGRPTAVVVHVLGLAASVLLYVHWRLASGGPLAWLILGMAAISVHQLTMFGLVAADPARVDGRPGMVLVTRLVLGVGVLVVVLFARRGFIPDPLAAGVGLGAALFVGRYAVLLLTPHLNLPTEDLERLALIVLLLDLTIAAGVAAFPKAPRWVRYRIAVALGFLALGQASSFPGIAEPLVGVGVVANLAYATVLLSLAIALVRLSIRDNRAAIMLLAEQLLRVEAVKRAEQAQLHEIRATIAGISSATRLVNGYQSLAPVRRARIRDMITAEISRLERLMTPDRDRTIAEVDLDATLDPLVSRLATQGHRVVWSPGGHVALGRADDVAEIVNVLLENAVRHGHGADVRIVSRSRGYDIEVVVSDQGPGVPEALREQIFEWGRSGAASAGEGIGLYVARTLSTDLGGSLCLAPDRGRGATFVLTLPAACRESS